MDFLNDIIKWLILLVGAIVLIANIFKFLGKIIKGNDIFERTAPVLFKIADIIKRFIKFFTNGGKNKKP